jgi:hypothetical protein
MSWSANDLVVLRNVWHGRVRNATPMRVVARDDTQVVLWHPEGVREWAPTSRELPHVWEL